MAKIVLKAKALKWGNSYGFRVAKADFERAKLQVGQEVDLQVGGEATKIDLSHLRFITGPDKYPGWSHEDVLFLDQLEKMERRGSIRKEELMRERKALEAKYARR